MSEAYFMLKGLEKIYEKEHAERVKSGGKSKSGVFLKYKKGRNLRKRPFSSFQSKKKVVPRAQPQFGSQKLSPKASVQLL